MENVRGYENVFSHLSQLWKSDLQLHNLQQEGRENLPGYQVIHFQL